MDPLDVPPFRPAWWLPGPHLQTLGGRLLRSRHGVPLVRERLELPDGDFVDLDFAYDLPSREATRPLVLLVHGLEGSARSGYAYETYRSLHAEGIDSVGLNFRSCSGELNRLPRMYHSGETGDLQFVLRLLADRHPNRARAAVGVSLGGNVLLKLLGETGTGARPLIRAAVAVSVPFDLAAGADHLRRASGRLYARYLLRSLRGKLLAKRHLMPPEVDVAAALTARDFRAFDDVATAPLHGFRGADDYYRQSSSAAFLDRIRIPTLLVHSADDPFLPARRIPTRTIAANPRLQAAVTGAGGHVGFVSGPPWAPQFWAERQAARFIAQVLQRPV